MRHFLYVSLVVFGLCHGTGAFARGLFTAELFLGAAHNLNSDVTVRQEGQEDLTLRGGWETRPFEQPLYWMIRLGYREPSNSWEIQLTHHKLYLSNLPPEIQQLEITHGFNLLTFNYAKRDLPVLLRAGVGVVLPHLTAIVRGEELTSGGFSITGPAFLGGVGKELPVTRHFFFALEGQLTLAWATAKVEGGEVETMNAAFHALVGIGVAL